MEKSLDIKELVGVLLELRSASKQISADPTEGNARAVMRKYDMIFGGGEFNKINTIELRHSLQGYFGVKVDNGELNMLIPEVCRTLGMECEPMVKVSDVGKSTSPYCYTVTLW